MMGASTRIAIFTLALVGLSRTSHADQPQDYRSTMREALAAKDRALDSGERAEWATALDLLRHADALQSAAVTKYEIGFAAAQLDQVDVALENLQAAMALGLSGKASERAREYIVSHLRRVAQLEIDGPPGTIILLRGVERARLPRLTFVYVTPGISTLEAVFPDDRHLERDLVLEPGRIVHIMLQPNEPQPPLKTAPTRSGPTIAARGHEQPILLRNPANPIADRQRNSRGQHAGWTLATTGATLAVLSAAFMPVAYSRLSSSREALREDCDMQIGGPDTCARSKPDRWQNAQSASNAAATWKMARTVSWVGLLSGVAATLGGGILIARAPRHGHPPSTIRVSFDPRTLQISYAAQLW